MDKKSALEIVRNFGDIVKQHLKVNKIVLYGSYANGNYDDNSDIDVAVIVDKIEGDYLKTESFLYKLRRQIDSRIEPVLLENGNDPSDFLNNILKTGIAV